VPFAPGRYNLKQTGTVLEHALVLVLAGGHLIVIVGELEPTARQKNIEVENISGVRLEIHTVENRLAVADIVTSSELGRVEEMAGTHPVERHKISESLPNPNDTSPPVVPKFPYRSKTSEHPPSIQPGSRRDLGHQAGFIAEFGSRRTRGDFHTLYGARGKLRRKRACSADR
jgi:hypothetical protein